MAIIDLNKIEYVTLYTGSNGSNGCTCKCPCCSQRKKERQYQGTLEQAISMFESLPNMKQLYVFGNPDITVDTKLCHDIIKEAVRRNIHVCFSTSGIGGICTLKKMLNDIPCEMVDYISFSFDGITKKDMSLFKGIDYPMEKALAGLDWAINNGYTVKVQPTLWFSNYTKVKDIIEYFVNKGVKWFTFHIGSLESGISLDSHKHLTKEQIKEVHYQIECAVQKYRDIKVRCPIIYRECGENDPSKWYCMHPERIKELLIIFEESGIKATHTPMASIYFDNFSFYLDNIPDIKPLAYKNFCPISKELSGKDDTCCRYISKFWNY